MKLLSIVFENWSRYRGRQVLELKPDVYAVMARHEADDERSNWLGKTSLLFAVPFGLYGRHLARLEDGWITNGEKAGAVELHLDDGTVVRRERKIGKSTQLLVTYLGAAGEQLQAKGPDAQRIIDEKVGLCEADFFASCFFEQKQMSRFITAKPAERHEVISAWLDLVPLQRCEENVRARLAALVQSDDLLARRLEVLRGMRDEVARRLCGVPQEGLDVEAELAKRVELDEHEMADLGGHVQRLQDQINEHAGWIVAAGAARDFETVVEQGKALAKEIADAKPQELEALAVEAANQDAECRAALKTARAELDKTKRLVSGEFDGQCPVTCEECPVADKVKSQVEGNAQLISAASAAERAAATKAGERTIKRTGLEARLGALKAKNQRLGELRARAKVLKPAYDQIQEDGQPPDTSELAAELQGYASQRDVIVKRFYETKSALEDVRRWQREVADIRIKREATAATLTVHREALVIVGRGGAQRQLAEAALSEIEADANALLAESDIALSIKVRWAHEAASGMARACDQCGAPFPVSQRAKVCEQCGAARGPLQVEKLDVELSDRSGAADDLAGIAFQLAAAAWLRRARGAAWSVAMLDEPFGALDEHNKRALATHLTAMLRSRYGFEQSFVVAHDRGVMDSLPGRIEVVGSDTGSRFV